MIVIYTSDQGLFLGEHGWFDKPFMYEESFQMHFLMRYPEGITVATVCDDMLYNFDFTPTFLDYAELSILNYMQGLSARTVLEEKPPNNWP